MNFLTQPHHKLILSATILSLIYEQSDNLPESRAIDNTYIDSKQKFKNNFQWVNLSFLG